MERRGGLSGRQWRDNDDEQRGGNRSDRRSQSRGERESHSREPRERRLSNSSRWTDEETNQEQAVSNKTESENKSSDDGKNSKKDEISAISIVEPDCENLSSSNDFEDNVAPGGFNDNSDKNANNDIEVIVPDPPVIRIEQEVEKEEQHVVEQTTPLYDEAPTESEKLPEEKTTSVEE